MLAVATASWIARLMPTPPTGDMAWAASPMQSSPGRYHRFEPVDRDGQQLDVVPGCAALRRGPARNGATLREPRAERRKPSLSESLERTLGDDEGALPVIAAVDHHEHPAGFDPARAAGSDRRAACESRIHSTSIGAPRSITSRPAFSRTTECRPSAADHEVGPDLERPFRRSATRTPATRPCSSIRSVTSACIRRRKSG